MAGSGKTPAHAAKAVAAAPVTNAVGSCTDIGLVREQNEDNLLVRGTLYAVADGMGGHQAGEVASDIALEVLAETAPETADAAALGRSVESANWAVLEGVKMGLGAEGMGTTLTAAILQGERLVIAQVGDSRAYLLHNGRLQRVTRDHSLMSEWIEQGRITEAQARVHPKRSMITRALGTDYDTHPDLYELNVQGGDRLLLCTDGLHGMLSDATIQQMLSDPELADPQVCAEALIDEANAEGGVDNITAVVVNIAGFAHITRRAAAKKNRRIFTIIAIALVAVLAIFALALNHAINTSVYLADNDGYVAIYRGFPDSFAGLSFSTLEQTTDVATDDLNPGLATRLREQGVSVSSMEAAEDLIEQYREDIARTHGIVSDAGAGSGANSPAAQPGTSASGQGTGA